MAKVRFCVDSGANINSCKRSKVLDTVSDLGLEEGEWEGMEYEDRMQMVEDWANDQISLSYEEVE